MPSEEKMSEDERRKYLKLVAVRYAKSGRRERGELLTKMGAVTGLHRKSLARLMNAPSLERAPRRPRLKRRQYGAAVADLYAQTNLRQLRKDIYQAVEKLWEHPQPLSTTIRKETALSR